MDTAAIDYAAWMDRWEAQQGRHLADREHRFAVMFDAVEAVIGTGPATVIDVGCGPGSLAVRLLDRFGAATVLAVDIDPVLLALGRGAHGGRPRLHFIETDLRDPGWTARLGDGGPVDAALSTTALHWLSKRDLVRLYADLAGLIRRGGVFLDGDHRRFPANQPRLARAARRVAELYAERRRGAEGGAETWDGWWEAARAEPALAEAVAERDRRGHAHEERAELSDDDRCRLLLEAGFSEATTLWQHGDDRILAAIR